MQKFRVPEILLGALLAVAIFAMGVAFESSRLPAANESTKTTANNSGSKISEGYAPDKITDWLLVLFSGLLVGSTVLLWGANNRSATIAEKALTNLERAYLFFSSATGPDITSSLTFEATMFNIFTITYKYKNSGRTPALLQIVQIGADYLESGFPTDIEFTFGNGKLPNVIVIGRDETGPSGNAQLRVSGEEFDKAKVGLGKLFFWGKLTYLDVLGVTHETGICSEWHFGQNRFVISKCDELNYYT